MSVRSRLARAAAFCLAGLVLAYGLSANADDASATKTIKADELALKVPAAWREGKVTNNFRKAQLTVPKVEGDKEDAELIVYYFEGAGGGVDANIQRWAGTFQPKGRTIKVTSGKSPLGDYVLVDLQGTWNKPIGRMDQQKTVEMPNARVLSLILTTKDGNYFLRLTGPEKTVSANADALRATVGADAKTEKPRPLTQG
jgi:hypothetical protein